MAFKESTGLRNKSLDTAPLRTILNLGFIKIYSGAAPATADAAVTGTLLCTISNASTATGLTFDAAAANGAISKASAETWSGVNAATGTAGYYRFVAPGDTGALSTTEARLQGDVGTAGKELNLSSVNLTSGATQTIDYYVYARPTL
jgi:hypothetical protein